MTYTIKSKGLLLIFLCSILFQTLHSQIRVGGGGDSPAGIEFYGTDKGLLLPRLNSTQMNALDKSTAGLIIYCTDCTPPSLYITNGNSFITIAETSSDTTQARRLSAPEMYALNPSNEGQLVYCTTCNPSGLYVSNGHGFNTITTPANNYNNDNFLISGTEFNDLFPYRADLPSDTSTASRTNDFYSYDSFRGAITHLSEISLEYERYIYPPDDVPTTTESRTAEGIIFHPAPMSATPTPTEFSFTESSTTVTKTGYFYSNYLYRVVRKKPAESNAYLPSSSDWDASWNVGKTIFIEKTIRYGDFLNVGSDDDKKQQLAALFAQISHETSGGVSITTDPMNKGLFYKEEVLCAPGGANAADDDCKYISLDYGNDVNYPPATGERYFGRGPIQLSWNYNYGFFSFVYYGDKTVLLNNPDKVLESGTVAFASAINFWMLPVGEKPSIHSIINEARGFATSVNIINGGLECGPANTGNADKVARRIAYYKHYATELSYTITESDANLKCEDLTPYE